MALSTYQLKCPNCGADLDAEDGIESFFCKYCGTKILLQGQSDAAIKAKANVQIADKVIELREKRYQNQRYREEKRKKELEEIRKKNKIPNLIMLCVFILILVFVFVRANIQKNESNSEKQVKQLQITLSEIQEDIAAGNYDNALIKTNTLYYTATNSSELKEQWDRTREAVIQTIQDARGQ